MVFDIFSGRLQPIATQPQFVCLWSLKVELFFSCVLMGHLLAIRIVRLVEKLVHCVNRHRREVVTRNLALDNISLSLYHMNKYPKCVCRTRAMIWSGIAPKWAPMVRWFQWRWWCGETANERQIRQTFDVGNILWVFVVVIVCVDWLATKSFASFAILWAGGDVG